MQNPHANPILREPDEGAPSEPGLLRWLVAGLVVVVAVGPLLDLAWSLWVVATLRRG